MNDIQSIGEVATATTLREFAQQAPGSSPIEATIPPHIRAAVPELTRILGCFAELVEGRSRRIADIRRVIQDETYETEERLNIAIDRLLTDF